jgi:hypothetical protein
MDGTVQVGSVIEDISEAASGVGGDGGGVVTADMGVNLFQFQRLQGLCNDSPVCWPGNFCCKFSNKLIYWM